MNAQHMDIHRFRESLALAIGADRFELWFGDAHALTLRDGKLVVQNDPFSLERVRTQFGAILQNLAAESGAVVAGIHYQSRAVLRPVTLPEGASAAPCGSNLTAERGPSATAPASTGAATFAAASPHANASMGSTVPRAAATRRSLPQGFVFGEENRLAQTAVQQVLASPGKLSPLFLHGPIGCGKSTLLSLIAKAPGAPATARRRVYVSAEQFTTLFVEALKGRGLPSFRQKFREIDLLAIDDLQFFNNKQATLVELKYTLDHLTTKGKQIVLAADRPPRDLAFFEPELLNRLTSGLVCGLSYPELAARQSILETICGEHDVALERSILSAIAQRLSGDVRQLRGAVIRLKAAALSQIAINDWSQVERLLSDLIAAQRKSVSWAAIEQAVCDVCGVSETELKSPKRSENVNVARNLAMWLSRKHIGVAFADIGRHYGGRSHSTVISANKKVAAWLQSGERVRLGPRGACAVEQAVREIESKLKIG